MLPQPQRNLPPFLSWVAERVGLQIPPKLTLGSLADRIIESAADILLEGSILKRLASDARDPSRHPELNHSSPVTARISTELGQDELRIINSPERRLDRIRALGRFLNKDDLDVNDLPVIGIACSGGGPRALIGTLGYLKGMEELNLLEATTYIAGVSGSTWAMAHLFPALASDEITSTTSNNFADIGLRRARETMSRDLKGVTAAELLLMMTGPGVDMTLASVVQRFLSLQNAVRQSERPSLSPSSEQGGSTFFSPLSVVDLFGVLLTARFLVPHNVWTGRKSVWWSPKLSNMSAYFNDRVIKSTLPFPIFTAVTRGLNDPMDRRKHYKWIELNPFEVGFLSDNETSGVWIPTW
jgi:phospholipase A2